MPGVHCLSDCCTLSLGGDCTLDLQSEVYWIPTAEAQYVTISATSPSGPYTDSVLEYCVYTTSDNVRHLAPSDSATSNHAWAPHNHTFFIPANCISVSHVGCHAIGLTDHNIQVCFSSGAAFCQYGTEVNPDANLESAITAAVIDAAILLLGGGALAILAFDTLLGLPLIVSDLCAIPPPAVPVFTNDDFIPGTQLWSPGSLDKRLQALRAAIWGFYCRCLPAPAGQPDPVPYPDPTPPSLPVFDGPAPLPIVCDNNDICSTLNAIMRQIASMNAQLTYARADIQLIQRQGVPFGYVAGTVHGPLSGGGEFAIADLIGLAVSFLTPITPTSRPEDPATYHQIGKVTVGTVDGWKRSWQPTHSPYLILPIGGESTKVGYHFPSGVVANITELIREP